MMAKANISLSALLAGVAEFWNLMFQFSFYFEPC